jgi:hypothetical protein
MRAKIEWITCPSGDWEVIKVNGTVVADGHSISPWDIKEMFRSLGHDVIETEVSDEQMEEGDY